MTRSRPDHSSATPTVTTAGSADAGAPTPLNSSVVIHAARSCFHVTPSVCRIDMLSYRRRPVLHADTAEPEPSEGARSWVGSSARSLAFAADAPRQPAAQTMPERLRRRRRHGPRPPGHVHGYVVSGSGLPVSWRWLQRARVARAQPAPKHCHGIAARRCSEDSC